MAKRIKGIRIPVSDEELYIIKELANENNLSMATYLRNLGLQKRRNKNINDFLATGKTNAVRLKEEYETIIKTCELFFNDTNKTETTMQYYNSYVNSARDCAVKAIELGYDLSSWSEIPENKEGK